MNPGRTIRRVAGLLLAGALVPPFGAARAAGPAIGELSFSEATKTSVKLHAQVTTGNTETSVTFEYGMGCCATFVPAGQIALAASLQTSTATLDLAGLQCGGFYRFRARASSTSGAAGPSEPSGFLTAACTGLDATGSMRAGRPVTLAADMFTIGGYATYSFDVDGDGQTDFTGTDPSLSVTYPSAFDGVARLYVHQEEYFAFSEFGAVSRGETAIRIVAPQLATAASGAPTQLCGDGDALPEPGERWRLPVSLSNAGGAAAENGAATFVAGDRLAAAASGTGVAGQIRIETPTVGIDDLQPGATVEREIVVRFADDAACGSELAIRPFGSVDRVSFDRGNDVAIHGFTLPPPAQCQVFRGCPPAKAAIVPRQGLYFDPDRAGNGLSNFVIANESGPPTFFGAWFTGAADRLPTWYVIQGALVDNQVVAPILRFTQDFGSAAFRTSSTPVGHAVITLTGTDSMTASWVLDGRYGAEQMTYFVGGPVPAPNRTGAWFSPTEGGWGQVVHQYVDAGVQSLFVVHYVYDALGQPRWVLAQGAIDELRAGVEHSTFTAQCPGCPYLQNRPAVSGMGSIDLSTALNGRTTTSFALPEPFGGGTWSRTNIEIQLLTDPQ